MEGGGNQVSRNVPRYTQRAKGGGLRGVYHEMFRDLLAVVSMHISEPQSRTVPMYIAFWQLHSLLYLEKSRDIWDSACIVQNIRHFGLYLVFLSQIQ